MFAFPGGSWIGGLDQRRANTVTIALGLHEMATSTMQQAGDQKKCACNPKPKTSQNPKPKGFPAYSILGYLAPYPHGRCFTTSSSRLKTHKKESVKVKVKEMKDHTSTCSILFTRMSWFLLNHWTIFNHIIILPISYLDATFHHLKPFNSGTQNPWGLPDDQCWQWLIKGKDPQRIAAECITALPESWQRS